MPYALQTVAKSFGIASGSMQDLYQKVQSGQISMKQLNDRFIELDQGAKGFHEAALNASAGIGTAVANMKNRVQAQQGRRGVRQGGSVDQVAGAGRPVAHLLGAHR